MAFGGELINAASRLCSVIQGFGGLQWQLELTHLLAMESAQLSASLSRAGCLPPPACLT